MNTHSHTHDDYTRLNGETRKLLVLTLAATPEQLKIYEEHRHYVGAYDMDLQTITERRLMEWACDPKREYVCHFCGNPPMIENGFMFCRLCKDYKGIIPNCNP